MADPVPLVFTKKLDGPFPRGQNRDGPFRSKTRMNSTSTSTNGFSLEELVSQLHDLTGGRPDSPTLDQLREACDLLYSSSLLKEEGRAVRARVIIAPPDLFAATDGPPDGSHAVRFATPHA